jgi:hypothetical protein
MRVDLQVEAALVQEAMTKSLCLCPNELTIIMLTIATTAIATLIMIKYSREPCALAMIEKGAISIKKLLLRKVF